MILPKEMIFYAELVWRKQDWIGKSFEISETYSGMVSGAVRVDEYDSPFLNSTRAQDTMCFIWALWEEKCEKKSYGTNFTLGKMQSYPKKSFKALYF